MKMDDFEKKLQRQPPRRIPGEWREQILRAAQEQSPQVQRSQPTRLLAVITIWRELIQPFRYAWSVMAALWLIFWMVNSRPELTSPSQPMRASSTASFERVRGLQEQRRILVELTGPIDSLAAKPSRLPHPKPRSERVLNLKFCLIRQSYGHDCFFTA